MADSKVSDLTAATSVGSSDTLYLVQSSTSKNVTVGTLFEGIENPTFSGNVTVGGSLDTVTSAGIIANNIPITLLTVGGTDGELLIHNGKANGQIKVILTVAAAGGTFYINKSNIAGNGNVQFDTIGDTATLMYHGEDWHMIGGTANIIAT